MNSRCEICYKEITEDDKQSFCNSCGQDYHHECIAIQINRENQCPTCKSPFMQDFNRSSTDAIQNTGAAKYPRTDPIRRDTGAEGWLGTPQPRRTKKTGFAGPPRWVVAAMGVTVFGIISLNLWGILIG